MVELTEKQRNSCRKCGSRKNLLIHTSHNGRDYLWCRNCNAKIYLDYYHRNPQKIMEINKRYRENLILA